MKEIPCKVGTHPATRVLVTRVFVDNLFVPTDGYDFEIGDRIKFKEHLDEGRGMDVQFMPIHGGIINNITEVFSKPFYWIERL
jgi:hypothetical protein